LIETELIEEEVKKFVYAKFPESKGKLELLIKNKEISDVNDEHIKTLVQMIYLAYFQQISLLYFNRLYGLVKQFAKAFKEKDKVQRLLIIRKGINKKTKHGLPVPNVEETILRNYAVNQMISVPFKSFNVGNIKYSRGDLNLIFQDSILKVMDVFWEIYLKHDVKVPFEMNFGKETDAGLGIK